MISGNHDSARRLGFGAALLEAAGVHLRTDPSLAWEPIVIDDVAFYGIPYLEPELVRRPWELPDRSHTAALSHAMRHIRADAERHRAHGRAGPRLRHRRARPATASATSASAGSRTCR